MLMNPKLLFIYLFLTETTIKNLCFDVFKDLFVFLTG